jgi:hypothetical protein
MRPTCQGMPYVSTARSAWSGSPSSPAARRSVAGEVRLVISDQHARLVAPRARVFQGNSHHALLDP